MKILKENALYLFTAIYVAVVLVAFPKWTVDDAYINFRYADNLASHSVLTWNLGKDPVEGYTGIALPLMLAALIKVGVSPVGASQTIGALSLLVGGLVFYLVLNKIGLRRSISSVLFSLYFIAPFMYTHAYSGLETVLFSTAILICFFTLLVTLSPPRYRSLKESIFLLFLLLTSLIRPEGVAFALTSICALFMVRVRYAQGNTWSFIAMVALFYILPGLLYFLWRWNLYGELFPNTFYAKTHGVIISAQTIKDLLHFVLLYLAFPSLSAFLLVIIDPDLIKTYVIEKRIILPATPQLIAYGSSLIFLSLLTIQYVHTNLEMNYSYRFFVPYFSIILIGIGILWNITLPVLINTRTEKPFRYNIIQTLLVGLFLGQLVIYVVLLQKEAHFASSYKKILSEEHIQAGIFLREYIPSSEWLIVNLDAGAIPYYSKLPTVDFGGLNDKLLARGISDSEAVEYFFSINAGAVVFTSYEWNRVVHKARAGLIVSDPRFERYILAKKYRPAGDDKYFQFVFVRKDLFEILPVLK